MRIEGVWAERIGSAIISAVMSGVMSAVFPLAWAKGWLIAFCVSFPTGRLVVPPVVRWQLAQSKAK